MCGLAALYAYHADASPVAEAPLARMADAMRSRGPDGGGVWLGVDGRVGLAHRRLAIIELGPGGAQPMHLGEEGSAGNLGAEGGAARPHLAITYNGEIYNFRELRAQLEAEGRRFESQSDTEVLLHLYDRDGPDMVHALRGMFAFAIWDGARRGLFLARDPFGIKPLYYADDGKRLAVASQVKALLSGGAEGGGPDAAGHAGFFLFGYVPEPHTLHAAIRALPAGSRLWVDGGGARLAERYFDPAAVLANAAPPVPRGDAQARLVEALGASVRAHLVSDVPVGVFLSAGLDSATITGLATEAAVAPLDTLTLAFEEFRGSPRDEAPLAQEVARTYGTRQRTERVRGADFKDSLDSLFAAMDQPSIDGVNTYFVARAAAANGLKVALSGLGGDELFAGYDSFRQIPTLVRAMGWIPGITALGRGFRLVAGPALARMAPPKYAGLLEYAASYGSAYLLRRGLFMPWELAQVMDADMALAGLAALDPIHRLDATCAPIPGARAKISALELSWYMRNQLLRDADWAGMAHSLEIRTPLVDAHLFYAVAGLGADKRMMAAAPATPLPGAVLRRPKSGFFVPVRQWLEGEGTDAPNDERGLRGWARRVYARALAN